MTFFSSLELKQNRFTKINKRKLQFIYSQYTATNITLRYTKKFRKGIIQQIKNQSQH